MGEISNGKICTTKVCQKLTPEAVFVGVIFRHLGMG